MIRSSAWLFIAKLTVALMNFGTVIMLSQWLGPADRGICGWWVVIIAISLVFSDMIAGPAAGFLLKDFSEAAIRKAAYQWALFISVITAGIILVLHMVSNAEAFLLLTLCWLNAANSLHQHLLLARKNFRWFNLLTILSPLLTVVFVFLLLRFFGPDRLFYLLGLLLSWLVCFGFGLYVLKQQAEIKTALKANGLMRAGFRNGIANQLSHFAGLLNNRLIYFLLPATVLGVYANALSLAEASLMIPTSLGQVLYASRLNNEKGARFLETTTGNLLINASLLGAIFVMVLFIPGSFYTFLFGPGFAGVKSYLVLLSVSMIFYGGYLVCSYRHSANGRFMNNFFANLAGVIVNITICGWYYLHGSYSVDKGIIALGSGFVAMFLTAFVLLKTSGIAIKSQPVSTL